MEQWQYALDRWLTTPPDDDESNFLCEECDEPFFVGDEVYEIEGYNLCKECAHDWLSAQKRTATEDDVYGDS